MKNHPPNENAARWDRSGAHKLGRPGGISTDEGNTFCPIGAIVNRVIADLADPRGPIAVVDRGFVLVPDRERERILSEGIIL